MDLVQQLEKVASQEAALVFESFDSETAWCLGVALRERAAAGGLAIAFEIEFGGIRMVTVSMNGATPDNADWIRRKQNTLRRFQRSSYGVKLSLAEKGTTLAERFGVNPADFVASGGCFPIRLRGSPAVLGSLTVSGLPDHEDHALAVSIIASHLGIAGQI